MAKPPNPPKKHHYVPQGYLRNFTNAEGWFYGYNKLTGKSFSPAAPKTVAYELDFHTDSRRANPQELEHRLDREFESPLLSVIKGVIGRVRLIRGNVLPLTFPLVNADEQRKLAKFASLQLVRTPAMRNKMKERAANYRTEEDSISDEEMARLSHLGLIDTHTQSDFREFVSLIARHRMMFLMTPPQHSFVINDNPVFVGHGTDDGRAFWGNTGLKDERLELHLPLSWDVIAVFFGKHVSTSSVIYTMDPESVRRRNLLAFEYAEELILGREPLELPS